MMQKRNINRDGSLKIFSSPSERGTYLYFTGRGDDLVNGIVGKGEKLDLINPDAEQEVSIDIGFTETVYLKDGYMFWENAQYGDTISLEVILPANTPMPMPDGNGNADYVDGGITYITTSSVRDETWVGAFMLVPEDTAILRFINDVSLIGTNTTGVVLESMDTAKIIKELRFRLVLKSESNNDAIRVSMFVEMYRENLI